MTVVLDGGELEVEVGEDLRVNLTGWARPVFAGRLQRRTSRRSCMKPSKRLERIPPYAFAQLERKIAEKRAAGVDVISLGIGDPDRPTPPLIVEAMQEAVSEPETHRYPSNRGREDFRGAVRDFYERRFDVTLDPEQRDHPGDRRQGGDLQPQPRVPGPGRLRARRRPGLSGLHRRPVARRAPSRC